LAQAPAVASGSFAGRSTSFELTILWTIFSQCEAGLALAEARALRVNESMTVAGAQAPRTDTPELLAALRSMQRG
jgi:hypothetical protein